MDISHIVLRAHRKSDVIFRFSLACVHKIIDPKIKNQLLRQNLRVLTFLTEPGKLDGRCCTYVKEIHLIIFHRFDFYLEISVMFPMVDFKYQVGGLSLNMHSEAWMALL